MEFRTRLTRNLEHNLSCEFDAGASLESAIAGDRDGLAQLLVEHSDRLTRRLASRLQLNPFIDFSLEDVLQEVFLDIDQGIGAFRVDDGPPFSAWLNKVADNRLAKMIRERSQWKSGRGRRRVEFDRTSQESSISLLVEHLAAAGCGTASDHVAREEVIRAVREGLVALPSDQRAAVENYHLAEENLVSTASELGKTTGAVRGLLHRARKAMRKTLGDSSRWFHRR